MITTKKQSKKNLKKFVSTNFYGISGFCPRHILMPDDLWQIKLPVSQVDLGKIVFPTLYIWVRSRNCGCLVTWFCYQLIAKPGNKTAAVSWPDPYIYFFNGKFLRPSNDSNYKSYLQPYLSVSSFMTYRWWSEECFSLLDVVMGPCKPWA